MPIPEISSSDDPLDPGPTIVNLPALQLQEPAVEIPKDRSENSSHATVASGAQGSSSPILWNMFSMPNLMWCRNSPEERSQ